ncbi:MAG: MarR family winged helix-turn-helix transcriptional regulator [Actinoallomurus sp.]
MSATGRGALADALDNGRGADALEVIEVASAVLVRNFELLRRRGGARTELDHAGYLLLRTLDAIGPADISTLAAGLGLDPSTAGRQVAAMTDKGLVKRAPAATDRRRSIISPTQAGLKRMHAARTCRREATAELLAGWSEQDLSTLGAMFTRYNRAVAERHLAGPRRPSPPDPMTVTEALLPPIPHTGNRR